MEVDKETKHLFAHLLKYFFWQIFIKHVCIGHSGFDSEQEDEAHPPRELHILMAKTEKKQVNKQIM